MRAVAVSESSAGRMVFANDQLLSREVFAESLNQTGRAVWLPLDASHSRSVRI